MPIATLEEIRLLSNLETTQNKLLQIVLFGQPELDEKIATREIRQLKERITYSFQLAPFKKDDIKDYLNSRLRTCGYRADDVFSPSAVSAMSKYSKGLLRRINILADKSLLAAYAGNTHKVTHGHVKIAARDSEFTRNKTFSTPVLATIIVLVLLVLIGGLISLGDFDQGLKTVQRALNSDSGSTLAEVPQGASSVESQPLVGIDSVKSIPAQPKSDLVNDDMKVAQEMVVEVSPEVDDIVTIYRHQDEPTTTENIGVGLDESISILGEDSPTKMLEPIAIGLTEQEFEDFRQQLVELPPEVTLDGSSGEICVKCSSIIYRPVL